MLKEIAVTPDVWLAGAFANAEHQDMALISLWKGIERGALIRDLSDGKWLKTIGELENRWHPRVREVVKHLRQRMFRVAACGTSVPKSELEWVNEAFASHQAEPLLTSIFTSDALAHTIRAGTYSNIVKGISKLPFSEPFSGASCSLKVKRDINDYIAALSPILKYSNTVAFIDPFLSPDAPNYSDFPMLLSAIARQNPNARVEIHRQRVEDPKLPVPSVEQWVSRFATQLRKDSALKKLPIQIFIWDEFHDRYIASNLIGLSIPYGLDTTRNANAFTRWTMLTRDDRDDLFQEFSGSDPHVRHRLWGQRSI